MISKKKKEEKQKIIEKRIMKFLSEIMRTVGFILLAGFSMIGAYFFYFRENADKILQQNFSGKKLEKMRVQLAKTMKDLQKNRR